MLYPNHTGCISATDILMHPWVTVKGELNEYMAEEMEERKLDMMKQDVDVSQYIDNKKRRARRSMPVEQVQEEMSSYLDCLSINMLKPVNEHTVNRVHCCYTQQ